MMTPPRNGISMLAPLYAFERSYSYEVSSFTQRSKKLLKKIHLGLAIYATMYHSVKWLRLYKILGGRFYAKADLADLFL